jgi:hypothetical protein
VMVIVVGGERPERWHMGVDGSVLACLAVCTPSSTLKIQFVVVIYCCLLYNDHCHRLSPLLHRCRRTPNWPGTGCSMDRRPFLPYEVEQLAPRPRRLCSPLMGCTLNQSTAGCRRFRVQYVLPMFFSPPLIEALTVDGTKYAIGMGRTQGIAKEVAARETLRILEAKWQRTVVMGGADSTASSAPIPSPPPFPPLEDLLHINPALRRTRNLSVTALPLIFDIASPSFSASLAPVSPSNPSPLSSTVLSEAAFYPLPAEINIMIASVPWPLEVVVPPSGLNVHDLLGQMHRKLGRPVPADMLAMCPADMQARARVAHHARLRGDPANTMMRRFDFLGGATRFAGLHPARGTAFEALFVMPREAPAIVWRFQGGRDTALRPDESSANGHDH